jgi:hypothetical protein
MTNSERFPAHPAETVPDHWLPPDAAGEPPLWLHQETEGIAASFVLALTGVTRAGTARAESPEMPFWPPVVGPRQGLEVRHQVADGTLDCVLRGYARAAGEAEAASGAWALWHNLAIVLGDGRWPYRLGFATDPRWLAPASGAWRAALRPVGLILRAGPGIGFHPATPWLPEVRLAFPALGRLAHFNALALNVAAPLAVTLSLRPFHLNPAAQAAVRQLRQGLETTTRVCYAAVGDDDVRDPALLEALGGELETWRRYPGGWRVRCTVTAAVAPPETLLALIGAEVFQGRPFRWDAAEPSSAAQPTLDLSDAIPSGGPLPPLFPAPPLLTERGLPAHYPLRPTHLADEGVRLGYVPAGYCSQPVRFAPADRARHCYLLGATGTGKSTLLYNLLLQDIQAGAGVCLLDPHGDLFQQVLAAIPPARLADVVLVEPGDPERAVGLNFLECRGPRPAVQMNFVANEMIQIFDRLYDLRQTGGPMFEQYMRNALLLVMDNEIPGGTLMDVPLLFEDPDYRQRLLRSCRNPYVRSFWRGQAERASGDAGLNNIGPYITSKLNQFTSNALLRPIIGQPQSTVDFQTCMDQGYIVLVHLPKGLLGALDARLLGMLIIGKLFTAALQRAQVDSHQRRPFYLYVDEAHHFTTDTVAQLLAEARKFGLYLTLANQNLAQVASTVDAILGNVGTLLLFRLGALDAERLATYVRPELTLADLEDLPDHHVAARLLAHGRPTRPFVFQTEPPPQPLLDSSAGHDAQREWLRAQGRTYTRLIAEVEKDILARREKLSG